MEAPKYRYKDRVQINKFEWQSIYNQKLTSYIIIVIEGESRTWLAMKSNIVAYIVLGSSPKLVYLEAFTAEG